MNHETFITLVNKTRLNGDASIAAYMALVNGVSVAKSAILFNISRQAVYAAIRRIKQEQLKCNIQN